MKTKVLALIALMIIGASAYAQKGKVAAAQTSITSGDIEKAITTIEEAVDPSNPKAEKSIPWAKTWMIRGQVYDAAFKAKKGDTSKALSTALESYKKAIELDEKKQFTNIMKANLTSLSSSFINQASDCYKKADYKGAYESFKQVIETNNLPIYTPEELTVDTAIVYNVGLAAYQGEMYGEAAKYFAEAAKYGYMGDQLYLNMMSAHLLNSDTTSAINVLKEGFQKYPEASDIVTNMVNLYLQTDNTNEAIKYLEVAIKQDPNNASFYFAQGALFDKLQETDKAIESYEKSIELKSDYFDPYYNLGVIYFNKGVKQSDIANKVPISDAARFEAEKKKSNEEFSKAIPYMEKASEINPKDTYSLESLKQLYYMVNKLDKKSEVEKKLEALNSAQ